MKLEHAERRREFFARQRQLALCCAVDLVFLIGSGHFVFACATVLFASVGAREAMRWRACGRYRQCTRSLETVGF